MPETSDTAIDIAEDITADLPAADTEPGVELADAEAPREALEPPTATSLASDPDDDQLSEPGEA